MTYVLSGAFAYGGQIAGSAYFVPAPQQWDAPLAESEWGPTPSDEQHRVVVFGVFELPKGNAAVADPPDCHVPTVNLLAGVDLNGDGSINDRYVDPATRQQVSINSGRGDPLLLVDMRATKFFTLGHERQRLGLFGEIFNLFNTVNFGENYQGNSRSALFGQPIGFLAGGQGTYPLTLQLGARLEF